MKKLQQLESFIRKHFPQLTVDIDEGKFGKMWLDVRLPTVFCVVGYVPQRGYSFDSVSSTDPWDGFGQNFSSPKYDFPTVRRRLLKLIDKELKPKSVPKRSRKKQFAAA